MKHFFNLAIQEDWENVTDRPTGAIELLMDAEVVGYLSPRGRGRGQLDGLEFWSAYAIVGTHPGIVSQGVEFTEEVRCIRQSGIIPSAQQYTNRIVVREVHMMNGKEFMEAKAIGVEPPRLCPDCRVCQKCIFRGQQHIERETF